MLAIKGKKLIDCTGSEPLKDGVVLIHGERISEVGSSSRVAIPAGVEIIDVGNATILSGMIDVHTHLGFCSDLGYEGQQMEDPDLEIAFRMARNARTNLKSGITTVRTLFEKNAMDMVCRKSIEQGFIPGPRIFSAGTAIRPSHGHGVPAMTSADGVDAMRAAVRKHIFMGVDQIKLLVTGGTGSKISVPWQGYFTKDEIVTAVEEAHNLGIPVAVHCHGGISADWCIDAGVDSIEHGSWLTMEQYEKMAQKGIWLVPTIGIQFHETEPGAVPKPPEVMAKRKQAQEVIKANVPRIFDLGVKIATGTDAFHGRVWVELDFLRRFGMKPMPTLLTSTKNAAELIHQSANLGTLEKGKLADIIAVEGDPLSDVTCLKKIALVIKGGRRYQLSD